MVPVYKSHLSDHEFNPISPHNYCGDISLRTANVNSLTVMERK